MSRLLLGVLLVLAFTAAQTDALVGPATCESSNGEYADGAFPGPPNLSVGPGDSKHFPVHIDAMKLPGHSLLGGALQVQFGESTGDLSKIAIEIIHEGVAVGIAAAGHLSGSGERVYMWKDDAATAVDGEWDPYEGNRPAQSFEPFGETSPSGKWLLRVTNIAKDGPPAVVENFVIFLRIACDGPKPKRVGKEEVPATLPSGFDCVNNGSRVTIVNGEPMQVTKAETTGTVVATRRLLLGKARPLTYVGLMLDISAGDYTTLTIQLWHHTIGGDNVTVTIANEGEMYGSGGRIYWIHDNAATRLGRAFNPNGHRPSQALSAFDDLSSYGTYGLTIFKPEGGPPVVVSGWKLFLSEYLACVPIPAE